MRNFSLTYKPFNVQEDTGVTFYRNFNSILRRDRQKNFLWLPRLWPGRRKEPILGYVPKNVEKKNLVHKGVKYRQNTVSAIIKLSVNNIHYYSRKYLSIPVIEFVSRFIIQLQFVFLFFRLDGKRDSYYDMAKESWFIYEPLWTRKIRCAF